MLTCLLLLSSIKKFIQQVCTQGLFQHACYGCFSTRNFGTIYYCHCPLAPVNGTIYYCQHTQFKSPKYGPVNYASEYSEVLLTAHSTSHSLFQIMPPGFEKLTTSLKCNVSKRMNSPCYDRIDICKEIILVMMGINNGW